MHGLMAHLKSLNQQLLEAEIDRKIADTNDELLETEEVANCIADTNATSWGVDDYRVEDIDIGDAACEVRLSFSAAGDQEDDQMFYGDRLDGEATVVINDHGDVEYSDVSVSLD